MFGCGAVGRSVVVETDGSVTQRVAPADLAQFYTKHCDYVAVGRFSAVTIVDYDRALPRNVEALFTADELLLGPDLRAVRVRISGSMLVRPGGKVSRNAAANVHQRDQSVRLELYDALIEDLRDLNETRARLTDERLRGIEERVRSLLLLPRPGPIDRVTEVRDGTWKPTVSHGTTFFHEGGAVDPNTQFLLGLDANENPGFGELNAIYMLLHWGDYAVAVAEAIRGGSQKEQP